VREKRLLILAPSNHVTDLNHTIRAQVTAKNAVNSASAMSAPTAVAKSPPTAS
jgi:hypothetical protein